MPLLRIGFVILLTFLSLLIACGGAAERGGLTTGGGGTGGGGGGGSNNAPTITLVTPSQAMTSVAASLNPAVYGTNFTPSSKIEINGAMVDTSYQSPNELWGFLSSGQLALPGVYSIDVKDPGGKSSAVSLTVYYPRQGPQSFTALPGYYTGPQFKPTPIAVADFNHDGLADIVTGITDQGDTDIAVLFGQADGSLGALQFLPGGAWSIAAGDVNGDGFADIVAGNFPAVGTTNNQTTSSITVLLNDGTGNFNAGTPQAFTGTFPGPMFLADMLGTGKNDLILASHNPDVLYLFPNQGDGTVGQPVTIASVGPDRWFTVADFDGDGSLDIAYSGLNSSGKENTHLLLNQGGGIFNDVIPTALSTVGGIVVSGDFNNDGRPDLAVETNIGTSSPILLETFLNQGSNVYSKTSTITLGLAQSVPYQFAVGDFDHDGLLDIAGENASGVPAAMLMLWGNGAGNFTQQQVVGPSAFELASGDINGDGIPDLIVPDELLGVTVILGNARRTYPQPTSIYPEVTDCMSVGDVNGDGAPDLFFCGDSLNSIPGSVFLNDGHGNFTLAGRPSYGAGRLPTLRETEKPTWSRSREAL